MTRKEFNEKVALQLRDILEDFVFINLRFLNSMGFYEISLDFYDWKLVILEKKYNPKTYLKELYSEMDVKIAINEIKYIFIDELSKIFFKKQ